METENEAGAAAGEGAAEERGPIPFNKFEAERKKAQGYRQELDTVKAEREQLAAKVAELTPFAARVAELEPLAAELGGAREALVLARLGVHDDDTIAALRALHGRQADAPPLPEWVRSQREAGEDAHPVVRSLLGTVPSAVAATPAAPRAPAGSGSVPAAGGGAPPAVSFKAAVEAAKNGDPQLLNTLREQTKKELAKLSGRR